VAGGVDEDLKVATRALRLCAASTRLPTENSTGS
jgi:hypothetical protein